MNKNFIFRKPIIITFVILGLFLAFFAGEIILRIVGYYYTPLRIENLGQEIEGLGKSDWRPFHEREDQYFVYDPNLIWRPKKNFRIFNAQGFRGPEVGITKNRDEYRIFTIGDSNTLGPQGSPGWPEYLGQLFQKKHPHVSVINAAAWGYTSWQGLKRFEEVLKYKPDMVLISFGSNDAHRVTIPDKEYVSSKKFFSSEISQLRLCQLFIAFQDILLMKNRKENLLVPRVSLKEYNDNINRIITLADKNHAKVILLTRPFIGKSRRRLYWKTFAPQYNELTMKIAKDRDVLSIDIYSHFKDKRKYFMDACHFDDTGYRIAAELIYDYVKKYAVMNVTSWK